MRNSYSKEFENYVLTHAPKHKTKNFVSMINKKFNCQITEKQLRNFLRRRGSIRCKDYNPQKNTCVGYPIGTEVLREEDGMVKVKTENGWKYKQRVIWEQHNGPIPEGNFVIFLDGDRTNFDISNLQCVTMREASLMANYRLYGTDKEFTKTGHLIAQTLIKTRTLNGRKVGKSHHVKGKENII